MVRWMGSLVRGSVHELLKIQRVAGVSSQGGFGAMPVGQYLADYAVHLKEAQWLVVFEMLPASGWAPRVDRFLVQGKV